MLRRKGPLRSRASVGPDFGRNWEMSKHTRDDGNYVTTVASSDGNCNDALACNCLVVCLAVALNNPFVTHDIIKPTYTIDRTTTGPFTTQIISLNLWFAVQFAIVEFDLTTEVTFERTELYKKSFVRQLQLL